MANVRFFTDQHLPLEMHKVRIVQKLNLPPIERRLEAITEAGNNTFLLQNRDIFLDDRGLLHAVCSSLGLALSSQIRACLEIFTKIDFCLNCIDDRINNCAVLTQYRLGDGSADLSCRSNYPCH
jgi:phosphoglycerate-specific signal transduction histidine kinase